MAKPTEKQMQAFRKLGYSEEQIAEILEDDKIVDGDKTGIALPWDLSPEEHKKAVKYANADERTFKNGKKEAPPRKPNAVKGNIIQFLFDALNASTMIRECAITNKERMLHFTAVENGKEYDLTLIEKRPKKGS